MDNNEFQSEMLEFKSRFARFAEVAEQRFDGLIADVRSNAIRLDKLEQRIEHLASDHSGKLDQIAGKIKELSADLNTLTSQFNQVGSVTLEDTQRIDQLESRVGRLEAEIR